MKKIKKAFTKLSFFIWPALITCYIVLISANLLALPIYLDEGIYIYWAYLFSLDPALAYVSMQDGKTPLFMWITALLNQPFNNLLFTGRLVSVFASTITLISFLIIGAKILNKKNLIIIFFLFLITPFNVLFSRLAFADALLGAFFSISLLTFVFFREVSARKKLYLSLSMSLLTGIFLGLAFMTKTTARIFLIAELILFGFLIFEELKKKQFKTAALIAVCTAVTAGVYFELTGYLRIGAYRFWGMISEKESDLIFSLSEIFNNLFITHTYFTYLRNLPNFLEYFFVYFNTVIIFFIAGSYWIIKNKKHRWLLFIPVFLTAGIFFSAKIVASRYFFIIAPEFLLISAIGFAWLWNKKSRHIKAISVSLLIVPAFLSFKIIFQPLSAYYPHNDLANFVDFNVNGLGLNESIEYLSPETQNTAIGVTGIWGVIEGVSLGFQEKGFEVHRIDNLITSSLPGEDGCGKDSVLKNERCWKINLGSLADSKKTNKYLYLNLDKDYLETIEDLRNIEVVKEFNRPRTGIKVYLIKINP